MSNIYDEIDSAIMQDNITSFLKRYGVYIAVFVLIILGGIGGFVWYKSHVAAERILWSTEYHQSMNQVERGDMSGAQKTLEALSLQANDGYYVLSMLGRITLIKQATDQKDHTAEITALYKEMSKSMRVHDTYLKGFTKALYMAWRIDHAATLDTIGQLEKESSSLLKNSFPFRSIVREAFISLAIKRGDKVTLKKYTNLIDDDVMTPQILTANVDDIKQLNQTLKGIAKK